MTLRKVVANLNQIILFCIPAGMLDGRGLMVAVVLAVVAIRPDISVAATATWNGNASANWADAANWSNAPLSGDSLVFALAGSSGTTLNNNLSADFSIGGITFNSGASTYTLNGNEITLIGNLANNSTSVDTINLPLIVSATRTITMTGGGGNVTLGGVISGAGGLTTAGTGTLVLNGSNNFTGATTVATNTVLNLGNATAAQNSTVTLNATGANSLTFVSGIGTFNLGGLASAASAGSFALTDVGSSAVTLSAGLNNASTTYAGVMSGGGSLVKVGTGTLTLAGANTYSGGTTVNNGVLTVTGASLASPSLTLAGGAFTVNNAAAALSFGSGTTLNSGASFLIDNAGAASLGAITRNVGATVNFVQVTVANFTSLTGTASTIVTDSGVAYATVGVNDWAAKNAGNTNFVGLSTISGGYTNSTASALSGNADVAAGIDTTLAADASITSLRFNQAQARTITLGTSTLTTGGILVTSTVAANTSTITGGTLKGAAGKDLVVIQNNTNATGTFTIRSVIADNGSATGLTKAGGGVLALTGTNTYTGTTRVNAGTLNFASLGNLGTGPIVLAGGTLQYATGNTADLSTRSVTFTPSNGTAATGQIGGLIDTGGNTVTFANPIGSGSTGTLIRTGDGTLILNAANAVNTSTSLSLIPTVRAAGGTAAGSGILQLGNANAVQNGTLSVTGTAALGFSSGIGTFNIGGLIDAGSFVTNDVSGAPVTINVGGNNSSTTFGGSLFGSGSLVKVGTGTFTSNANNDNNNGVLMFNSLVGWTGNLTINAGAVTATAANSALGRPLASRTITANTGTVLNMNTINVFGSMANNDAPAVIANGATVNSNDYNAIGDITLNGSNLAQSSTRGGDLRGYQFRGTVTVGGAAASTISSSSSAPNHLGPNTVFNVADATSSSAVDLSVTTPFRGQSNGFSSIAGGLTKSGAGTMAIAGINTYTGSTNINQGTFVITGSTVPASADTGTWGTASGVVTGLVNGTGGLFVGEQVTGNGIPAGTYVQSIDSATQITLTGNPTIAGSTTAINFNGGSGLGGGTTGVTTVANGATLDASGATGGVTMFSNRRLVNNGTVVGAVNVPSGTIQGTGSYTGTANLSGTGAIAPGTTTTIGTLTLGNLTASGGTLAIKAGGATSDVVNVTGNATFTGGTVSMQLGPTAPTSLTYNVVTSANPIIGALGAGAGTLGRATYTVSNTGNSIRVQFSAKPAANLTWAGGTTNWDNIQTDANWTTADSGIADTTHFYDGDYVAFSNNSGGTVNFNSNVAPTIATVSGTGNYTFASAGGSGLTGAGTLVKTGTGSLTLSNTNTHSGGVTLNQGTLNINTAGSLGGGTLTINGGTLDNTSGPPLTLSTNNAQVWAANFTFNGTSDLNLGTGAVTLNGNPTLTVAAGTLTIGSVVADGTGNGYTKSGPGTLVLTGRSVFSGALNIVDGVVKPGIAQQGGSFAGTTAGPTNISGTGTLDIANQSLNTVEPFNIQGNGFGGQGAIVNNGVSTSPGLGTTGAQISRVKLTGDASLGGVVRWDMRGNDPQVDLAGHTLTKVGGNFVDLVSTQVRSTGAPGIIDVASGTLGIEANSSLNSAVSTGSVLVESGGNLNFWSTSGVVTWPITLNGNNDVANGDTGASVVASNITLAGSGVTIYPRAGGAGPLPPVPGDRLTDPTTGTNFGSFTLTGNIGESGGSFGLTKEQNGTLILAGNNTFTGGLTINGGVVQLNSAGALNSTTPDAVTMTGFTVTNANANLQPRLRLNGNNVTVNGLNSTGGNQTSPAIVENNHATTPATLTVMVGNNPTFDGILRNGAAATLSLATTGAGTFFLTGANTYTGGTTVGPGSTLQIGNGGTTGAIASGVSGAAGSTLSFNRSNDITYAGVISGAVAVNKLGPNTLTLSGTSTTTGATTISAGTLALTGALASTAAVNVNSGGVLSGTGNGTTTGLAGNVTLVSGGSIRPGTSGNDGSLGTLKLNSLTVSGGNYRNDIQAGIDLINVTGTANFTGVSTITPIGASATAGTFTILQAGTLTIGTTPQLVLTPNTRFTLSLITNPGANGTLQLTQVGTPGTLIWKGNVNSGGNFLWDLNSTQNFTLSGNPATFFNLDAPTFDDTATNKTVTVNSPVQPSSVTVNNSGTNDYTFTGTADIGGGTGITKNGTGTLTISNTNTYAGTTTINQGTLNANASGALGAGAVTVNGGTLNATSANALGTGTITVSGGTLNATTADALGTGGNGIVVSAGTLNANSSNFSRTGPLTLNGGNLNLADASALGSGALTFSGGTLDNTSGSAATLTGNNTQIWGGSFAFAGSSVDNSHDLNLGAGAVTLNGTPSFTVSGSASTVTVDGAIADGTGTSLTKAGPGTLLLRGLNTFSGALNVTAGTLKVGSGGGFGSTAGATNISGGGTLDIDNQSLNTTEQFNIAGAGVGGLGAIVNSGAGTTGNQLSRVTLTADATIGGAGRWDLRGNAPILDIAAHKLTKSGPNMISLVSTTIRSTGGAGVIDVASGVLSIEAASTADLATANGSFVFENGAGANFWNITGTVNWPVTFKGNNNFGNGDVVASTLASPITLAGPGITLMPLSGGIPGGQPLATVNSQLTLTGSIGESGGSFGLTKEGVGTVTLSGANTFTGGLTINNGIIQLNNSGALNSTLPNAVTINGGASGATQPRLQLNGISVTVGGLNSTGGASATPAIVENSGATPATLTVKLGSNPTFDGILRNGTATLSLATSGSGKLTLTGVNTYTGSTTVGAGGTVSLGVANGINAASALVLGGGRFDTGGLNQQLNAVTLTTNSGIDMGNGASVLKFADSSAIIWQSGAILSVLNWSGNLNTGGGTDQLIFGATSNALTSSQIGQIHFQGFNGSKILASGEIVPTLASTRLLGDFDVNGHVNAADITTAISALTDLNAYKLSKSLSSDDLLNIADVDLSGTISNADLQGLINVLKSGGGSGAPAVPEPASAWLAALGLVGLICVYNRNASGRKWLAQNR